jgi:Ca2+-binding RTX toxin-like protein
MEWSLEPLLSPYKHTNFPQGIGGRRRFANSRSKRRAKEAGNDDGTIKGEAGDDTIRGDYNNDNIDGGDGEDTIYGGLNAIRFMVVTARTRSTEKAIVTPSTRGTAT